VQAELVVKAQQEVGEVMGELGLAFIKLAKFETRAGFTPAHAADAKCVATGAVKASRFYRECNAQSVRHLVRPQAFQVAFLFLYLFLKPPGQVGSTSGFPETLRTGHHLCQEFLQHVSD
jgi:hypothetical protein